MWVEVAEFKPCQRPQLFEGINTHLMLIFTTPDWQGSTPVTITG